MNNSQEDIWCFDCKMFKPIDEFFYREASKNKMQPRCKVCQQKRIDDWNARTKHEELISSGQLFLQFGN